MHFPEFALLAGAADCLSRLKCIGMDGFQGKVEVDILDFSSLDIIFHDLRKRLTDVSSAKRSLVIGELDQCQLCIPVALIGASLNIQINVQGNGSGCRSGSRSLSCDEKALDLLQFLLNGLLASLECLDLASQVEPLFTRRVLCQAGWRTQKSE